MEILDMQTMSEYDEMVGSIEINNDPPRRPHWEENPLVYDGKYSFNSETMVKIDWPNNHYPPQTGEGVEHNYTAYICLIVEQPATIKFAAQVHNGEKLVWEQVADTAAIAHSFARMTAEMKAKYEKKAKENKDKSWETFHHTRHKPI